MPELSALCLGLIAPDLDLLAALLAPDVLRFRRPYFSASWTTFLEHGPILLPAIRNNHDLRQTGQKRYSLTVSFTAPVIANLKL